ncbi:LCP family protein [Streptomyces sp. P01-B04]|uniref:LCP family protein n=1 Tax=Streptomyces poriferorum TaxID=2798799 RepID=UPI001C5E3331|nr:LCP family protein [Streptomyces poriferorum]MBW5252118.1 LCP family protein [Streptomyces poriferorum]MBW5260274.1 LCP family protein [Streptomyces poriferorum]
MTQTTEAPAGRTRRRAKPSRRRVAAGHGRRKRGWLRIALTIGLSILVLVTAGAGWLYLRLNGNIDTFGADGFSKNRPAAEASRGANVLVIGTDARTGGNSELGGGDKSDIGRSDTAFLLHVYADHQHAVGISIPRDTLVPIPSCKLPDGSWSKAQTNVMFNSAYSTGGTAEGNPACTQNTVEQLTGLRVDHTVVVDFKGFSKLTDVVGGVQVCLPNDVYQKDLNPNRTTQGKIVFEKGEQSVSGQKALDYVRIRHGIGDGSDIGRIKRQQAFISSLITKIKKDGFTPTKLLPLADAATKSMTVDPGLGSADELLKFAMSLKSVDLHNTKFVTIPWRYEGNRVAIVQPDADALWAALKDDRTLDGKDASGKNGGKVPSSPSPSASATEEVTGDGVSVAVYNGTTTKGLAAEAASSLTEHGFTVTGTTNATTQDHSTTSVTYGPGQKAEAETLAALFPDAELTAGSNSGVSVVLGSDYAPGQAASATPTALPSSVADGARSADEDICSNLSYG